MNKKLAISLGALALNFSTLAYANTAPQPATDFAVDSQAAKKEILAGKWQELKGHVKEKWGKLTDDDIVQIDGKKDILIGKLRAKYGYSQEQANQEVEDFIKANSPTNP